MVGISTLAAAMSIPGTILSQFNTNTIPHFQLIGQEALNVGIKHLLRDNLSYDEFSELVNSITFEEAKGYLTSRLTSENMREISFIPQGK